MNESNATRMLFLIMGVCAGIAAFIGVRQSKTIDSLTAEVALNRGKIVALEKAFIDHYQDSTNFAGKVYTDLGRVRFTVKAIANSLKFTEAK